MVSFTASDHARVAAGKVTVTWRLWKYGHVKAGRVYASGFGGAIEVEDVRAVRVSDVTDADAHEVSLSDAAALIELARSHTGATITPDTVLYRVQFRYLPEVPARPELPLDVVVSKLERLDSASTIGPWTEMVLRLIEDRPATAARYLAADLGLPLLYFKANVRKLKTLGLTTSLIVGYELSPLGQTYLDSLAD
jgi:hypothetical protein